LTIYGLNNLTTLDGLHNLTSVQNLKVAGNGFASFESLTALKTIGNLEIGWKGDGEYGEYMGGNLTSLKGLEKITEIEGSLSILGPVITTLQGLSHLSGIGGRFALEQTQLTDLNGLQSLVEIGGECIIGDYPCDIDFGNKALVSLSGLDSLERLGGNLIVKSNAKLPLNEVDTLVQDLTSQGWTGETETCGNLEEEVCLPGECP
jgi:hypothetical protein